jgi:hypothetical protein
MSQKTKKPLSQLSDAELLHKQQELQFMGTHFGMYVCEVPADLNEEYSELLAELARRSARQTTQN